MITATSLRRGMVIKMDNELYVVANTEHITPGNWRAMVQTELRGLKNNRKLQKRFRSTESVEEIFVEYKTCEYIYPEADSFVFMDTKSYEQITLHKDFLGDAPNYLILNCQVNVTFCEGKPVAVELPSSVVLEIVETEPGAKGDTRTNVFKPATVETGLVVKVPLFIKQGEKIKVDTRTGEFLERA